MRWVTVYRLSDPIKAEVIGNALEAQGIRCFLDGVNQAAHAGLGAFDIKIQVPEQDRARAQQFLQTQEERWA
jgi:Putative prokaryotic signal transducing protein